VVERRGDENDLSDHVIWRKIAEQVFNDHMDKRRCDDTFFFYLFTCLGKEQMKKFIVLTV
jgi:hypothetical protein